MKESEMVDFEQLKQKLQSFGYAIVVFSPEELEGANPCLVEDRLIETGWDIISSLSGE